MRLFACTPGNIVKPLGEVWAAFSTLSGETLLLNDEGAAILEVLGSQTMGEADICAALAADSGSTATDVAAVLGETWVRLIEAGLIREQADAGTLQQ